jgi:hypothetical protein
VATQGVATFMSRYGPEDMERRQGSACERLVRANMAANARPVILFAVIDAQ